MPDELLRRQFLKVGVGFIAGTGSAVLFNDFTAVLAQSNGSQPLKFPRQQDWESKMCTALGMTNVASTYAGLTPFQKAIGTMGLSAAEAYFPANKQPNIAPQEVFAQVQGFNTPLRNALTGLIAAQIIAKLKLNQNDAETIALRDWAIPVFRQMKVDVAVGTLNEYNLWKKNPCKYSAPGYQPPQRCTNVAVSRNPYALSFQVDKPPSELLLKAGLAYAAGNSDLTVQRVATGIAAIGLAGGFLAATSGLGVTVASAGTVTALYSAFGGSGGAAAGAIGATSWAGVVAGPAAVIAAAALIGVSQGITVIESEQAEFKLKQAIAAAMGENINTANVVTDEKTSGLFLLGMLKSAADGWKAPSPAINGEVTFFCEAGYVAKFYLNYTLNGQQKSFTTGDMSVGFWQTFAIPAAAQNIEVKGVMLAAGEKQIFRQTLQRPTYVSYKVYGTVFQPAWNNDWPRSVSGEISSTAGELKFTHGAGFVAKWQVTYDLPGKPNQSINSGDTSLGWKKTYNIPLDATNVRVLVQGATGLLWEPWRTTYGKTFSSVPNLCLKIYGTTLNQQWNNDCS
ncbi:hypothetical protein H6F89_29625 [Cyanobacteria bacterium FACHB-63]|nr:hypothetical protein [Cyanobacteria bacterium FACHB-63]